MGPFDEGFKLELSQYCLELCVCGGGGELESEVGLIRVALLLYPPPTRPLGPLPDPYPIPRGYLIHTGQKIK